MGRQIIHVDMDEFFAAVEKLDNPELRGKCLLVGGSASERGVVSTASYEARKFGCHSAMPMAMAIRLCPHAIVLPGRHERYAEISRQVFAIFERFTPMVEPLSIDEAFLDVTGSKRLLGDAPRIAADIQRAIAAEIGLTASLGVAPNKFLAKIASDLRKPNGLVVVTAENIHATLDPLPIRKLWGTGPATEKRFERMNIRTVGQLRQMPLETLRECFGESAEHYHRLASGIDDRPVTPDSQAKSIGQEQTFAQDVEDIEELRRVLLGQVEQVAWRLRHSGLSARTVTLKLRHGDFTTLTRSVTTPAATNVTQEIWNTARTTLEAWAAKQFRPLRLIGVTASGLAGEQGGQLSLFDDPAKRKLQRLDKAADEIARRFGQGAIRRAGGVGRDSGDTRDEEEKQ